MIVRVNMTIVASVSGLTGMLEFCKKAEELGEEAKVLGAVKSTLYLNDRKVKEDGEEVQDTK